MIKAVIRRTDLTSGEYYWQEFNLPWDTADNHTVLGLLNYLQTTQDDSLGFDYACRFERCGLCGMVVNGEAGLACRIACRSEMRIEPLRNLPLVRDLVIDRRFILPLLKKIPPQGKHPLEGQENFRKVTTWKYYSTLAKCNECLCCLSNCPQYDYKKTDFGGPFLFVKLAQLIYREKDLQDLKDVARQLGIKQCLQCRRCLCPAGIPVFETAIEPFLELL